METGAKAVKTSKRRNLFIYLLSTGAILIIFAFLFYKFLIGQAFADRGVSKNSVPTLHSPPNSLKQSLLDSANEYFKCSNPRPVDISHLNSVGMFPYLIKNGPEQCNKAADFVGYDNFISAMLNGEQDLGVPAKSFKPSSLSTSVNHHPGLKALKELLSKNSKYDRSVEFYWWMFPIPMGIPNRGFAYAIFQGDLEGLQKAAKARNLIFEDLYLEGLKIFLTLQGWDIEREQNIKAASKYSYDQKDHVITKAWISLKCFSEYPNVNNMPTLLRYKKSLEAFMEKHLIRYPADFSCTAK